MDESAPSSSRPGLPPSARRTRAWALTVAGVVGGAGSLALALQGNDAAALVNCVTVVVIGALLAYGPRRHDPLRRTRRLLLAALGAAFTSGVMAVVYELVAGHAPAHPWAADGVALVYAPFTIAGLMLVPAGSQRTGYRVRAIADGLFAVASLWYLVAGLAGQHVGLRLGQGGGGETMALITAAGDVCVVATALTVLSRCSASVVITVGGIAGGLTAIAAGDTWLLLSGRSPYSATSVLLDQSGLLLLVLATALPALRGQRTLARLERIRWGVGAAPFLPLLVCIGMTVVIIVRGQGMPSQQVLPALLVAITLMARQYASSRDKQRLVNGLRERETRLESALRRDALTGLANRLALMERLTTVLPDRRQWPVAVALLDLNDFKLINDNHGHAVGDEILRQAAARLAGTVRGDDLVVRLGGDEFAVVATGFSEAYREAFVGRLLSAFDAPLEAGGERYTVAASVGIVLAEPSQTAGALLAHADAAMYRAKEDKQTTTGVTILQDAERLEVIRYLNIREQIASPDLSQFQVHYQPIVDLAEGRTRGFEALLRWTHPELGAISPEVFIPLAEQAGSISLLGQYVLTTAAADLSRLAWSHRKDRLFVSVNVSPRQLTRDGFAEEVLADIAACGLAPHQLTLEITEHSFASNLTPVEDTVAQLTEAGIAIAIDDFGMGYSTLRYLQRLRPKVLKVDRGFIAGLADDPDARRLVSAVHTMAQTLGLRVVAEGIETADQLDFLRAIDCELGQGYLFSAAVPASELSPLVQRSHLQQRGKVSRIGR